jgi:hypothetical protein
MAHPLLLLLVLAQDADPAAAAPAPAAAAHAAAAPAADAPPQPARSQKGDEVRRIVDKLNSMKPEERTAAIQELQKRFGTTDAAPVLPPADVDLDKYLGLPEEDQVRVSARRFMADLVSGDVGGLVSRVGVPFFLEDRRFERVEDLRAEWGKNLRQKRTDLLTLYDVEVLNPAAMEKKYGKPPNRLNGWNWRTPKTYLAVVNTSGHATVLMLRQAGLAWQVIGFHD